MPALYDLLEQNQNILDPELSSYGYGVWLISREGFATSVTQTFEEYGGLKVLESRNQELWYFFNEDVFQCAAKLAIWAKYNTTPLTIQIFTATLSRSSNGAISIKVDQNFVDQTVADPIKLQIFTTDETYSSKVPGVSLQSVELPQGFNGAGWKIITADQRLPYKPLTTWYSILKPIGEHSDRAFQLGWREFYNKLEDLLQRNKLRYTMADGYLIIPVESLRSLKSWCSDYLALVNKLKLENDPKYWPSILVNVDKKGLSLNSDLPQNINLEWDLLMPDHPYVSMREAILMDKQFTSNIAVFERGRDTTSQSTWATLDEASGEQIEGLAILPDIAMPCLAFGEFSSCFYCGQHSHQPKDCPSKNITDFDLGIWKELASYSFSEICDGVTILNKRIKSDESTVEAIMDSSGLDSTVLRSFFAINATSQLRSAKTMWRVRGKEYPNALFELQPEDSHPIWQFASSLNTRSLEENDKELTNLSIRFPRDFRVSSLHGFIAMELGDYTRADDLWAQAHIQSHPGVMKAWNTFLRARLAEYRGHYHDAIIKYGLVFEACPKWVEAKYRQFVCHVKSGFASKALPMTSDILNSDPHFFNWMFIDPELERGDEEIRSVLKTLWSSIVLERDKTLESFEHLGVELSAWFTPEHEFLSEAERKIAHFKEIGEIAGYVPAKTLINGYEAIEKEMHSCIINEGRTYKGIFQGYVEKLSQMKDEAAWFPFPRALGEFNRNYNTCAINLNWILSNNMRSPDVFRKAQELVTQEKDRIKKLEKRLKLLRIVRDGTLFGLVIIKKFLLFEIIGLALVLLIFPLLTFYGADFGLTWFSNSLKDQQWQIQKAAIIIVSLLSLFISGLITSIGFEKTKEKTFSKAIETQKKQMAERAKQIEARRSAERLRRATASAKGMRRSNRSGAPKAAKAQGK